MQVRRRDLRWPIPVAKCRGLEDRTCRSVTRRSKYLLLEFDGEHRPVAIVHLGMSGRLWVDRRGGAAPAFREHEHWRMDFGTSLLRYVDPRRFGMLDVTTVAELRHHKLLHHLGPEPLGSEFGGGYIFARSRGRKVATKTFLMDAKNVVGIGNIYASETCFRAGLRPRRAIRGLTRAQCGRLAGAAREILERALAAGGTTLRDFISADESAGYFRQELMVYDRAGEPCRQCGAKIKRTVDGGRSTYYCPGCQA